MLILTRRVGESLVFVQDNELVMTVRVLGVKGNQVRIGIAAPKEWGVHRDEVWHRIETERKLNIQEPVKEV